MANRNSLERERAKLLEQYRQLRRELLNGKQELAELEERNAELECQWDERRSEQERIGEAVTTDRSFLQAPPAVLR